MSLTTILSAKDLSQSYQPLLLCEISWSDGTILRLATHDLRSTTTGVTYDGHDWKPQIINQDNAAKQALSSDGIDSVPTVQLSLADADRFLWNNYEQIKGFKGASLLLRFVFYDVAAGTFSTDSQVVFKGICDPPNMDEATMTIKAVSKMNMTRANLPTTRIQVRDPHPFPNTAADRVAALNDPSSPFYACGYSPDVPGGFGNLNPTTSQPYTADDYDGTYQSYLKVLGSGSGVAATGTVTLGTGIASGQVDHITITSGGSGYVHAPTVVITGNGSGATATATISGGVVTGVSIHNVGNSYTTASVTFTGGLSADLLHDEAGHYTGTFGGVRWVPPNTFNGKKYTSGKIVSGQNAVNQNLYSDFVPMVYGVGDLPPESVQLIIQAPPSVAGRGVWGEGTAFESPCPTTALD